MRRFGMIVAGVVALALIPLTAGPAFGGDYHRGATLICSDCHVMHYSQSHGYSASGAGIYTPLGTTGPHHMLLRNNLNDLCLTCHDGQTFAPDVLEANTLTNVREAGALNREGTAPYYTSTGHTLDSPDTAPGGTWAPDPSDGLVCVNCHHQHGRGGPTVTNPYRNLNPSAGGMATFDPPSYAVWTNDTSKDVFERASNSYSVGDVDFNEPDQTKSAIGNWCGACHSNFHGGPGSVNVGGEGSPAEEFLRHPTAGVNIGALGGGHSSASIFATASRDGTGTKLNYVKVMTATGNWTPKTAAEVTDHTPTCVSCHKGHGNKNSFGLIYMNPTSGAATEEGTGGGTYKNLCSQCHVQG